MTTKETKPKPKPKKPKEEKPKKAHRIFGTCDAHNADDCLWCF